ncbi:MAG: 16S rRNA (adenine(1518)-N(6)/adenine(1519)-N(6))-dimethyltransferase RsmA, partial [bacterium]
MTLIINNTNTYKKKSLGQHFLNDFMIVERIVSSAEIDSSSSVIEIGPGQGSLTKWIYESKPKRGVLIEIDGRLIQDLKINFPEFQVINEDVCEIHLSKLLQDPKEKFVILGNLPYNVSTKILEHLIEHRDSIDRMVLMFQKEVGERIYSGLRTKEYGRLTLLSQEFFQVEKLFIIGPRSFSPPPKVDSVVISFVKREQALINLEDRRTYDNIIKLVFSSRRKMIRRSLRAFYDEEKLNEIFAKSGVEPSKRPEELTIHEFAELSNVISRM